jgi:hypothetical protein
MISVLTNRGETMICRLVCVPLMLAAILAVPLPGRAEPPSPLERYRNLMFPPIKENFNKG